MMEHMIEELEVVLTYCKSARRANQISLCKLQIRDEIQPRIEKILSKLKSGHWVDFNNKGHDISDFYEGL